MKNGLLFRLFLLLIVFFALNACNVQNFLDDEFGPKLNPNRISLGVPVIEDGWVLHKMGSTHRFWSNPYNRVITTEPDHLWKRIYLKDSVVTREEDIFHYETRSDTAYRLVSRWFPIGDSTTFRFITYFKKEFPPTAGKEVDFQFSDSVLVKWGFKKFLFGRK